MNKIIKLAAMLLSIYILSSLAACEPSRESVIGLHLPEGSVEDGRTAFIDLKCFRCHTVMDVDLPVSDIETPVITINLGGEVYRVKTYGELLSSIINPKHVVSMEYIRALSDVAREEGVESIMPSFNDEMTVAQMIDLVTFLDSHYKKLIPEYRGHDYAPY